MLEDVDQDEEFLLLTETDEVKEDDKVENDEVVDVYEVEEPEKIMTVDDKVENVAIDELVNVNDSDDEYLGNGGCTAEVVFVEEKENDEETDAKVEMEDASDEYEKDETNNDDAIGEEIMNEDEVSVKDENNGCKGVVFVNENETNEETKDDDTKVEVGYDNDGYENVVTANTMNGKEDISNHDDAIEGETTNEGDAVRVVSDKDAKTTIEVDVGTEVEENEEDEEKDEIENEKVPQQDDTNDVDGAMDENDKGLPIQDDASDVENVEENGIVEKYVDKADATTRDNVELVEDIENENDYEMDENEIGESDKADATKMDDVELVEDIENENGNDYEVDENEIDEAFEKVMEVSTKKEKDIKEIRRELDEQYEERVYGGAGGERGEYDEMWKVVDKLLATIKENEEDWTKRSREETAKVKRKEKEERMKRVEEKRRKFGKFGKETKGEKRESEENIRRKLALIEIRKNMWRSYRVGSKVVKMEDYLTEGKRGKEKRVGERRKEAKKEKAAVLKDSWKSMKALLDHMEDHGEEWDNMEKGDEERSKEEDDKREEVGKRKREEIEDSGTDKATKKKREDNAQNVQSKEAKPKVDDQENNGKDMFENNDENGEDDVNDDETKKPDVNYDDEGVKYDEVTKVTKKPMVGHDGIDDGRDDDNVDGDGCDDGRVTDDVRAETVRGDAFDFVQDARECVGDSSDKARYRACYSPLKNKCVEVSLDEEDYVISDKIPVDPPPESVNL